MKNRPIALMLVFSSLASLLVGCAAERAGSRKASVASNEAMVGGAAGHDHDAANMETAASAPEVQSTYSLHKGKDIVTLDGDSVSAQGEAKPTLTLASMTEKEPERYLIRNANVSVEVADARKAADDLRARVVAIKGYVGNAHETVDYNGSRTITLQARIPYQRFDEVLTTLGTLGKALDTQVTAEDVTEEFVDTQATLRNLKRTESRLLEHLGRTGKLSDTLLVEKELNRVREEIERREGRLRFLANRISFSTIDVTLKEAAKAQPIVPAQSFSSAGVASEATRSLVGFAQGLWSLVIWLGVWAVVWLPIVLLLAYLIKRSLPSSKPQPTNANYPTVPPLPSQPQ